MDFLHSLGVLDKSPEQPGIFDAGAGLDAARNIHGKRADLFNGFRDVKRVEPSRQEKFVVNIGLVFDDAPVEWNAGAAFIGRSFSKNQWSAGIVAVENVTASGSVGVVAGIDDLWGGGKIGSANIVAGGLTLKAPCHPFTFLSSVTNSWTHTVTVTPYVIAMVATPINGTGSADGGLGSITRAGVNLDLYNFKGWKLGAGIDYGKRTGAGNYSGNWGDLTFNIRKGF